MLCKGNCGNEAIFGKWCVSSYYQCPGYKKKLSIKAKFRGNNGSRGLLSKKYFGDKRLRKIFDLICSKCGNSFKKELFEYIALSGHYVPKCSKCISEKVSKSLCAAWDKKLESIPYDMLGLTRRKKILWKEQGYKCNKCGFNLYNLKDGPYEMHHIDGNRNNQFFENEEVLCCNCHAMTDTFRFKNQSHKEKTKSERFGGCYKT